MKWVISLELNKIKQLNTLHYYINMCFQQKHLRGLRIYLQIIRKIQSKIAIICLWRDNPFANVQQNAHLRTEPGEYARYCLILGICLMITFSTIIPYSPRSPFHILGMLQLKFSVLTNQGKHSLLVYLFQHVHIFPGCLQERKLRAWFLIKLEEKDLLWWCWQNNIYVEKISF